MEPEQTSQAVSEAASGQAAQATTQAAVASPDAASSIQSTQATTADAVATKPARPDKLDASYWNDETGELNFDAIAAAKAAKDAIDARSADIPADVAGYEIKLPDDFKLPDGFSLNLEDPLFVQGRELAKAKGFTKGEFNDLAALVVKSQLDQHNAFMQRLADEKKALGPNAEARVQSVITALSGRLGEAAKAFVPMLVTAAQVQAFETLLNSSSMGQFTQTGRDTPAGDGKPSNWDSMSPVDRRTFQLAQQMTSGR